MKPWRIWYLERQVKLTAHAARHWDVWVCGHCGRAVDSKTECICARGLPKLPAWKDVH